MSTQPNDEQREALGHSQARTSAGKESLVAGREGVEDLANVGLPPWELHSLGQRLAETAARRRVPVTRFSEELIDALEHTDRLAALDAALAARQAELKEIDAAIEARREDSQRLSGILAGLRREQDHIEELLPSVRERATMDIKRLGDEAVLAIRDQAVTLRRELDLLLQQSLDVAKTAAAVDAEVRSKEWLKRLLDLVENGDDVRPLEVRALTFTLLNAVERWMQHHPSATPSDLKDQLSRLIAQLLEWRG